MKITSFLRAHAVLIVCLFACSGCERSFHPNGSGRIQEAAVSDPGTTAFTLNDLNRVNRQNGPPAILFSDLTHAPKTGWSQSESNKGAAVTIWGRNFGETRGDSFVTVNGAELKSDNDYAEWNADSFDVFFLKRITFWLNSSCQFGPGHISVTVEGKKSNAISFTVNDGTIVFCDGDNKGEGDGSHGNPYRNPGRNMIRGPVGEIRYIRQSSLPYDGRYLTGKQNFFNGNITSGTPERPNAILAYPCETPEFVANDAGRLGSNFHIGPSYWTIAKLKLRAVYGCIIITGDNCRIIGNDCLGCQKFASGTGIIVTQGSQTNVFGNSCHDGNSANKLDHAIYISGNASRIAGTDCGWNYIHDNDFDRGPLITINHQQARIPAGENCKEHRVHHNLVDASKVFSRCLGIYQQNWEPKNPNGEREPEATLVYNNIFIGNGTGNYPMIYHYNGRAHFYYNTIFNGGGSHAFQCGKPGVLESAWVNNLVFQTSGKYFGKLAGGNQIHIDNNLWFGIGDPPSIDRHAIAKNPQLDRSFRPQVELKATPRYPVKTDFYNDVRETTATVGAVERE